MSERSNETASPDRSEHFIEQAILADHRSQRFAGEVVTRFPPEPNGFLHIGHAKSICLNFGIAERFGGRCYLRMDDTNPSKESETYVRSIHDDVRWLGYACADRQTFASDYFEQLYDFAETLIRVGAAYVDSRSLEVIRATRGTLTQAGRESPDRNRSVEENLDLFRRMRAGEFAEGAHVLRAKIDMAASNINMRDPVLYRIRHARHHRTGDAWCIYPMYDYTHCLSDYLEGITHSLCTLEFEDHRPLYDWVLDTLATPRHPQQIEFSRLGLEYTVLSKRQLNVLVDDGHVDGWDDPRMPTVAGMRRRGITPAAIRDLCDRIGVTKADNTVEMGLLENCVRADLEAVAPRGLAVVNPLKVVLTNAPADFEAVFDGPRHPKDAAFGVREIPLTRELYIERDDFMAEPPRKYKRLSLGAEVRLRYGYIIRCDEAIYGNDGEVRELRCSVDENSGPGGVNNDRKVNGVIHWVSARYGVPVEARLYDRLFTVANPSAKASRSGGQFTDYLNADSLSVLPAAVVEPAVAAASSGTHFQFERLGYFYADPARTSEGRAVFNRTVTLRDTWAKIEAQQRQQEAARG